jgi:alkanesulfonate monooxygenase SsuD/methylene tetrahydromethanopterin reductase-like flavin-dependent oxidoreductase (luciferase family)
MTDIGIASLTDIQPQAVDGRRLTVQQRLDQIIGLAEQADRLGLHHFGVGEHHSADFAVSSPAVVLGAVALRTRHVRLTSSVTTLSVHDPCASTRTSRGWTC